MKSLKALERDFWARFPFVKRKRYARIVAANELSIARVHELENIVREMEIVVQDLSDRIDAFGAEKKRHEVHDYQPLLETILDASNRLATNARADVRKLEPSDGIEELCLFVTHSDAAELKPHVHVHCNALIASGIRTILIINADVGSERIRIPEQLSDSLCGIIVRDNSGFDFGAWAHAYSLVGVPESLRRLFLVNDSIVGPLSLDSFARMIARIRGCDADFVGLTENPIPKWHLQSYFLVINQRLLHSPALREFMGNVLNLPTKQGVIDLYETQVALLFLRKQFRCASIFPHLAPTALESNDTVHRWQRLIEAGFPYIKTSVLRTQAGSTELERLVPGAFRTGADTA